MFDRKWIKPAVFVSSISLRVLVIFPGLARTL